MSYDWDHQREYAIENILAISSEQASESRNARLFTTLGQMCADMKVYSNVSAEHVYHDIITNRDNYTSLIGATMDSMKTDGWIGALGYT